MLATQLFYESKGRKKYVLSLDIEKAEEKIQDGKSIAIHQFASNVSINIYEVKQIISAPKIEADTYKLTLLDITILELIKNNPCIKNVEIAQKTRLSPTGVSSVLKLLKEFGYISNKDETGKKIPWIILRDLSDDKTPFIWECGKRIVYKA